MDFTKQTYCNQVASYIRTLIREGKLEIGAQIKEASLAEQLGISRAPIREALQTLVQEGLITSEPQKGKYVRQMSSKEIYDSYAVAGILEGAGVASSLSLWTALFPQAVSRLADLRWPEGLLLQSETPMHPLSAPAELGSVPPLPVFS